MQNIFRFLEEKLSLNSLSMIIDEKVMCVFVNDFQDLIL